MTAEHLRIAGEALFGGRWKTEIARALGVDTRRVRQWTTSRESRSWRPIPEGVWADVDALLADRSLWLQQCRAMLKTGILPAAPPPGSDV